MRQNGNGTITFEDARTWIEETGLCLFLPRRQFASSVAPSFVEAVAGQRNATPDPKQIALAEDLLVRLEKDGVVVRLNLHGLPGEQPDFIVAAWVLPYVYALRGDRDWRRSPQLTGSRQVSQLAVQAYKLLETKETNVSDLRHELGREVTEAAVIRAITELWQQLRIIPMIDAPGESAKWQLLRIRFQKAIAEGASTSQVTAISVLASIYLQAVIATTMEDVEVFLSSLTARSKVREVLRGLVATRQVHTIALGHAPHFYVAGTLPEFSVTPTFYASSSMAASSSYFLHAGGREVEPEEPAFEVPVSPEPEVVDVLAVAETVETVTEPVAEPVAELVTETLAAEEAPETLAAPEKVTERPRFSRPAAHSRDHKPAASGSRPAHRGDDARSSARPASAHGRTAAPSRWAADATKGSNGNGKATTGHTSAHSSSATKGSSGKLAEHPAKPSGGARTASGPAKPQRSAARPVSKAAAPARKSSAPRSGAAVRSTRKPAMAGGGAKASSGKRFSYADASRSSAKKRG
jgi:hypothetical protein